MKEYNKTSIEKRWQEKWEEKEIFKTSKKVNNKENYYVLTMFPYPSGNLHMGHVRNYTLGDVIARYKKMKGYNVLHPIGWDSFGLPAENAAIKFGVHPAKWTKENISVMKKQLKLLGISYDWDREIATYKEDYYKWNQWFFKKMYEKGLAYKKKSNVNWCPKCETVLANEQVVDGKCWQHPKTDVIQKDLEQWFYKITEYADELLEGHEEIKDGWAEQVLTMQKNWIGKSYGTELSFILEENEDIKIPVFTTRPDTLFGVTYCVLAPEHPLVDKILKDSDNKEIQKQVTKMKNEDLIARSAEGREKNGVFTGKYVINPINGEKVQLWIGDYVLMNYGTGAVMAVPAHDKRDFVFAKKYNLPIKIVILPKDKTGNKLDIKAEDLEDAFIDSGIMVNSGEFSGVESNDAMDKISSYLEIKGKGKKTIKYRLKDWGVSRQRYWGTPIPAIYCDTCGIVMELDENLPVILPTDINFDGKGNPLENSENFKNVICPTCGGKAKRETDTMDTFVDSSWYYLRFITPKLDTALTDKDISDLWTPVDQYIGGIEHAVMHLIYSRFYHKVLRDLNLVSSNEPFKKLLNQGMVLSHSYYSQKEERYLFKSETIEEDDKIKCELTREELVVKMEKMSKSKNNGVDPLKIIKKYGADTARLFVLFAAPPERDVEWSENGVAGAYRFLNKMWKLVEESKNYFENSDIEYSITSNIDKAIIRKLHQTIKKITTSIEENYHFNTSIAAIMELFNKANEYFKVVKENKNNSSESMKVLKNVIENIVILLSPFTPHICEELWKGLGKDKFICNTTWPEYIEEYTVDDSIQIAVQVNGKLRGTIDIRRGISKEEIEKLALSIDNVKKHTNEKNIIKIIVIQDKIVNIVVK